MARPAIHSLEGRTLRFPLEELGADAADAGSDAETASGAAGAGSGSAAASTGAAGTSATGSAETSAAGSGAASAGAASRAGSAAASTGTASAGAADPPPFKASSMLEKRSPAKILSNKSIRCSVGTSPSLLVLSRLLSILLKASVVAKIISIIVESTDIVPFLSSSSTFSALCASLLIRFKPKKPDAPFRECMGRKISLSRTKFSGDFSSSNKLGSMVSRCSRDSIIKSEISSGSKYS